MRNRDLSNERGRLRNSIQSSFEGSLEISNFKNQSGGPND
jgi:hypothetical protein